MPYSAYVLSDQSRTLLLERYTPRFPEVIAHHITHQFPNQVAPPPISKVEVVGYASDDRIECLVVSIDGVIKRPSGGYYHITLSLDRAQKAKPVHSNHILKRGWETHEEPFVIEVTPELLGL